MMRNRARLRSLPTTYINCAETRRSMESETAVTHPPPHRLRAGKHVPAAWSRWQSCTASVTRAAASMATSSAAAGNPRSHAGFGAAPTVAPSVPPAAAPAGGAARAVSRSLASTARLHRWQRSRACRRALSVGVGRQGSGPGWPWRLAVGSDARVSPTGGPTRAVIRSISSYRVLCASILNQGPYELGIHTEGRPTAPQSLARRLAAVRAASLVEMPSLKVGDDRRKRCHC